MWTLNLFVITFITLSRGDECPDIVSRAEWGALPAMTASLDVYPATNVLIHQSSTPTCNIFENCAALARSIQKRHMHMEQHRDIKYNFLVGEDGLVYEGVGWGKAGTHDDRLNSRSIGICFMGEYTSWLPNEAAQSAVKRLIECGVSRGHLDPRYRLLGHRQVEHNQCPGLKLYQRIKEWNNWAAAPR